MSINKSHGKNKDKFLDRNGVSECSAADLRNLLDNPSVGSWGGIIGDINNQVDLISLFNTKVDNTDSEYLDSLNLKHNVNEDTGTIENSFQLDSDNMGIRLVSIAGDLADVSQGYSHVYASSENVSGSRQYAFQDAGVWITAVNTPTGRIAYDFGRLTYLDEYRLVTPAALNTSGTQSPRDWTLQGSNDSTNGNDGTWSVLDTVTGNPPSTDEEFDFSIDSPGFYKMYRMVITSNNGWTDVGMRQLKLINSIGALEVKNNDNTLLGNLKVDKVESNSCVMSEGYIDIISSVYINTYKTTLNSQTVSTKLENSPTGNLTVENDTNKVFVSDNIVFKAYIFSDDAEWIFPGDTGWFAYKFDEPTIINRYVYRTTNTRTAQSPKEFYIHGSNNSTNGLDGSWTVLGSWGGFPPTILTTYNLDFTNTTKYSMYKVVIADNNGWSDTGVSYAEFFRNTAPIVEFKLHDDSDFADVKVKTIQGSISDDIEEKTATEVISSVNKAHNASIVGVVSPTAIVADYVGQVYVDTVGLQAYIAISLTVGDWKQVTV